AGGLALTLLLGGCGAGALLGGDDDDPAVDGAAQTGPGESTAPSAAPAPPPDEAAGTTEEGETADPDADEADEDGGDGAEQTASAWQRTPEEAEHPSDATAMEQIDYLTGGLTPKSVMASGHGLAIANNMMYSHTSTVFDVVTREQVAVLEDSVDLEAFGVEGHPGISQGSPVEAVWTDDGRYAYVSQYTMYGQNFGVEGFDACTRDSGVGPSFLYRFDAEEMAWDQVIKVGAVPKYLEITPDQIGRAH